MACANHADRESVAICMTCKQELCDECRQVGPDGKSYCPEHVPADVEMPPMGTAQPATGSSTESPILAALCYLCWILTPISFLVPVIVLAGDYKQSRYMRYHAYNGIFWGLALIVIGVALSVALWVMKAIGLPGFIRAPLGLVSWAVLPVGLIASILFASKANNRQDVKIPGISGLADKQVK